MSRTTHAQAAGGRRESEFLASMSHELRAPLNSIIGFAELLYDGKVGQLDDKQRRYLGHILHSSQQLLRLINNLLDLAKLEAGRLDLEPDEVPLSQAIWQAHGAVEAAAAEKGITIEVAVDEQLGTVFLDPSALQQVLHNYLSNALKYTPDGGRVRLRAMPEEAGFFRIDVEDSGVGIAEPHLGRLFDGFQQASGSRRKEDGTGLSLAITKRLAEAQGGRVEVASTPGQGSTFSVILPRRHPSGISGRTE